MLTKGARQRESTILPSGWTSAVVEWYLYRYFFVPNFDLKQKKPTIFSIKINLCHYINRINQENQINSFIYAIVALFNVPDYEYDRFGFGSREYLYINSIQRQTRRSGILCDSKHVGCGFNSLLGIDLFSFARSGNKWVSIHNTQCCQKLGRKWETKWFHNWLSLPILQYLE